MEPPRVGMDRANDVGLVTSVSFGAGAGRDDAVRVLCTAGVGICRVTGLIVCLTCWRGATPALLSDRTGRTQVYDHFRQTQDHEPLATDHLDLLRELYAAVHCASGPHIGLQLDKYLAAGRDVPLPRLAWAKVVPLFLCPACARGYDLRDSLRRHVNKYHTSVRQLVFSKVKAEPEAAQVLTFGQNPVAVPVLCHPAVNTVAAAATSALREKLSPVQKELAASLASRPGAPQAVPVRVPQRADDIPQFLFRSSLYADFVRAGFTLGDAAALVLDPVKTCDAVEAAVAAAVVRVFRDGREAFAGFGGFMRQACTFQEATSDKAATIGAGLKRETYSKYGATLVRLSLFAVRLDMYCTEGAASDRRTVQMSHAVVAPVAGVAAVAAADVAADAADVADPSTHDGHDTRAGVFVASAPLRNLVHGVKCAVTEGHESSVLDTAVVALLMHLLVERAPLTVAIHPLQLYFACSIVRRKRCERGDAGLSFVRDGGALSTAAAALRTAASFVAAVYVTAIIAPGDKQTERAHSVKAHMHADTTPGGILRMIITQARYDDRSQPHRMQFQPCLRPEHGLCGIVDGHEFSATRVGVAGRTLIDWCNQDIASLLKNADGEPLDDMLLREWSAVPTDPAADSLSAHEPGAWFGAHTSEQRALSSAAEDYVTALALCRFSPADSSSVFGGSASSPRWPLSAEGTTTFRAWHAAYQRLLGRMLAAMLLLGGGGMRGTEFSHLHIRDAATSRIRDVYVYNGSVVVMPQYSKTFKAQGRALRPRFLPDELGRVFVAFIRVIAPMRTRMLQLFDVDVDALKDADNFGSHLLVTGTSSGGGKIRDNITRQLKAADVPFSVLPWRHFQTGIVGMLATKKALYKTSPSAPNVQLLFDAVDDAGDDGCGVAEEEMSWLEDCMLLQGSHSVETARTTYAVTSEVGMYGRSAVSAARIDVEPFRAASLAWHCVVGFGGHLDTLPLHSRPTPRRAPDSAPLAGQKRPAQHVPALRQPCLVPAGVDAARGVRTSTTAPASPTPGECKSRRLTAIPGSGDSRMADVVALSEDRVARAMEAVTGANFGNRIRWTSGFQARAVWRAASARYDDDVFVVLPTGGGNTAVALVPAVLERDEEKVTVIVVPFVALAVEYASRVEHAGLRGCSLGKVAERGAGNLASVCDVLIVVADQVGTQAYRNVVGGLMRAGACPRIVVDEAHVHWMCAGFRPALGLLRLSLRPDVDFGDHRAPRVVGLSATAPPDSLSAILHACGMVRDCTCVIRARDTVRKNLEYRAMLVRAGGDLMRPVFQAIRESQTKARGSGSVRVIIYHGDKDGVDRWCDALREVFPTGLTALRYHAGMAAEARDREHGAWCAPQQALETRVMVATSAFGVGIDSSNVRVVVHVGLSACASIVDYAQESGRAGRDGQRALCLVVHAENESVQGSRNWREFPPPSAAGSFSDYVLNRQRRCRVELLHAVLDGPPRERGVSCRADATCDACIKQLAGIERIRPEDRRGPTTSVRRCGGFVLARANGGLGVRTPSAGCTGSEMASVVPMAVSADPAAGVRVTRTEENAGACSTAAVRALGSEARAFHERRRQFDDLVENICPATRFCGPCAVRGKNPQHPMPQNGGGCLVGICTGCFSGGGLNGGGGPSHRYVDPVCGLYMSRGTRGLSRNRTCQLCGMGSVLGGQHVFGKNCTYRSAFALALSLFWKERNRLCAHVVGLDAADVRTVTAFRGWLLRDPPTAEPNIAAILRAVRDGHVHVRA